MIQKIISYLKSKLINKEIIVKIWEFEKKEITKEDQKIYLSWKDVLWVELKYLHNRLLTYYQKIRFAKIEELPIIQANINELYYNWNRLNIIVNPEMYMSSQQDENNKSF